MSEHAAASGLRPPGLRHASWKLYTWLVILSIGLFIGLFSGLMVLLNGLGITNLSDQLPWGLWITVDLSFIAMGAGGFTLSAAVYIFGLKQYEFDCARRDLGRFDRLFVGDAGAVH